jgi:hypothetical protein
VETNSLETDYKLSKSQEEEEEEEKYNNSIKFIYVQNSTAQRPITKLAQARKWEE